MNTDSPVPVCLAAISLLHALPHSHQLSHAFYIASILSLNTVGVLLGLMGERQQVAKFDTIHVCFFPDPSVVHLFNS
jgi:hypothetical protein